MILHFVQLWLAIYVAQDALGFYGQYVFGEVSDRKAHWRFVEHDIAPVKRTKYKALYTNRYPQCAF